MKKAVITLTVLVGAVILLSVATSERLTVKKYIVKSAKVKGETRIVHISDHHSSNYGDELIEKIVSLSPDMIVLTGDIADNRVSNTNAFNFMEKIGKLYPCYYVSGNHEVATKQDRAIKDLFTTYGITVLEGEMVEATYGEDTFVICGIDDPNDAPDRKHRMWEDQLADCAEYAKSDNFSLLLTHRPELVEYYNETDFDLVLAGHAHGGQVRIPFLLNGLYAPNQGWFPKYAGGRYDFDDQTMIVSRGLSKYVRPRVFNRPELVVIDVVPE